MNIKRQIVKVEFTKEELIAAKHLLDSYEDFKNETSMSNISLFKFICGMMGEMVSDGVEFVMRDKEDNK